MSDLVKAVTSKITTQTVGSLSTYELRQELVRRGAFDLEEDAVNHKTLLKRLMVELVKDEAEEAERKAAESLDKAAIAREEAKRLREERKREALERSKQRQADPEYFKRLSELNKKPETAVVAVENEPTGNDDAAEPVDNNAATVDTADGTDEPEDGHSVDPFRPQFALKQRSKIFVR